MFENWVLSRKSGLFKKKKTGHIPRTGEMRNESKRPLALGCIHKFPDRVDNEINNTHLLTINTKGYGGKTHWTDSQNSDTIAPNGRELYHLQFSLQAASPETFGYTLVKT
jgi:hypothetical protein